ncbi:MAG: hypothetical protein AAGJ81_04425 [Verrucomicrobiota bacterium]
MKRIAVLLTLLASATVALAAAPPGAEEESARLLRSIETGDYKLFLEISQPAFQTITKKDFDSVVAQLEPRMKDGFEVTYLGTLDQQGFAVTLWKLKFSKGDDALATLSMKDGKVGGYWIR